MAENKKRTGKAPVKAGTARKNPQKPVKVGTPSKKQKPKPERPVKEPKPPKLRNIRVMMYVRNVVIALIIGIFVMGVFVIVRSYTRGDGTQAVRAEISANMAALRYDFDVQTDVKAFAQNFIKDYFTYHNRDANEYRTRLKRYCTDRLVGEMVESLILKETADALYAQAVNVEEYAKNQYDVTVVADVLYTKHQVAQSSQIGSVTTGAVAPTPQNETTKSTFYITVPVWSDGQGGFVVEDIPMLIAPGRAAGYNRQDYSGTTASDSDKTAAQQMLNDFFKTMYSEPQNKIDYYLADDADKQKFAALELNGIMTFERIDSFVLYNMSAANEFIGIVSIRMTDVNGTEYRQRFNITLVKKGKYFAKDINTRTYNFKP